MASRITANGLDRGLTAAFVAIALDRRPCLAVNILGQITTLAKPRIRDYQSKQKRGKMTNIQREAMPQTWRLRS